METVVRMHSSTFFWLLSKRVLQWDGVRPTIIPKLPSCSFGNYWARNELACCKYVLDGGPRGRRLRACLLSRSFSEISPKNWSHTEAALPLRRSHPMAPLSTVILKHRAARNYCVSNRLRFEENRTQLKTSNHRYCLISLTAGCTGVFPSHVVVG